MNNWRTFKHFVVVFSSGDNVVLELKTRLHISPRGNRKKQAANFLYNVIKVIKKQIMAILGLLSLNTQKCFDTRKGGLETRCKAERVCQNMSKGLKLGRPR